MNALEQSLINKGYRIRTVNGREEWYKARGLLQPTQHQPSVSHEPVAEGTGEDHRPGFCVVRIKSFRTRLIDERNLYDKAITDALRYAGIIRDDSPQWCKVEVSQIRVGIKADERTEIDVTACCRPTSQTS
jgi:hypothetical protein